MEFKTLTAPLHVWTRCLWARCPKETTIYTGIRMMIVRTSEEPVEQLSNKSRNGVTKGSLATRKKR